MTEGIPSLATLTRRLAVLAHDCWRWRMSEQGWRPGAAYDQRRLVHDELRPFDTFQESEQDNMLSSVAHEGFVDALADAVMHEHGPERPFVADELKVGMPVALDDDGDDVSGAMVGFVESWELDLSGRLALIRVRWSDGEVSEHHPGARELRRFPVRKNGLGPPDQPGEQ